jgi:hypothetical protein
VVAVGDVIDFTGLRRIPIDDDEPAGRGVGDAHRRVVEARGAVAAAMRAWNTSGSIVDLERAVDAACEYQQACSSAGERRASWLARAVGLFAAGVTAGLSLVALAAAAVGGLS